MDDNHTIAISHFSMATNFLHLVENILGETIARGNVDIYVGKPIENLENVYEELTKWSDFRIMIPTLFLFFHGIELLLKGAKYKAVGLQNKPDHNLAKLFGEFKIYYPNATELTKLLNKYIYPDETNCKMLYDFYVENDLTDSNSFYELLKYPYSKNLKKYHKHGGIRFLGLNGINHFHDILSDIHLIKLEKGKL